MGGRGRQWETEEGRGKQGQAERGREKQREAEESNRKTSRYAETDIETYRDKVRHTEPKWLLSIGTYYVTFLSLFPQHPIKQTRFHY